MYWTNGFQSFEDMVLMSMVMYAILAVYGPGTHGSSYYYIHVDLNL